MVSYSFEKFFNDNPRDYDYETSARLTLQLYFLLWASPLVQWENYLNENGFYIPVNLNRLGNYYSVSVGDPPQSGQTLSLSAPRYLNLEGCSSIIFYLLEKFNQP